jgi:hypothetical protein
MQGHDGGYYFKSANSKTGEPAQHRSIIVEFFFERSIIVELIRCTNNRTYISCRPLPFGPFLRPNGSTRKKLQIKFQVRVKVV